MHYCMSDIHGCFDDFLEMLEIIEFNDDDILYIIGDAIDRGNKPLKTIEYIRKKDNIIHLKGNHELMAVEGLLNYKKCECITSHWKYNGGDVTFENILKLNEEELDDLINYFDNLNDYLQIEVNDKKFLLVHGGFDTSKYDDIEKCDKNDLLWFRGPFFEKPYQDKMIVMGHIPTLALSAYIQKALFSGGYDHDYYDENILKEAIDKCERSEMLILENRCFIDCGRVFKHNLGCLRLEDFKEYYIKNDT